MAGDRRIVALAHDVAHGAGSAGRRCQGGNVAVGGHAAARNRPDGREHSGSKASAGLPTLRRAAAVGHQRPITTLTLNTAPPRSSSPKAAAAPDGSVKASGTLIQPASPAMPSHRPTL